MGAKINFPFIASIAAMRFIFLICFFTSNIIASVAQNNQDTAAPHFQEQYQFDKATICLMDKSKILLKSVVVNNNSLAGFKDDTVYKNIRVSAIHSIRIKRNGVVKGLAYGAVIGGIVGYGVGYVTYSADSYYADTVDAQGTRAAFGALIGAAPGAFVGGIIGGIFTKRHFRINGDMKNFGKMFETLKRAAK
jgi:hypothetical protein